MVHADITVTVIRHENQRYETVGDYVTNADGCLNVAISRLPDWRHVRLIAIHEIIEATLCKASEVTDGEIDQFDMQFEADRALGRHGKNDEPGDDPRAPYRKQHLMATAIEKMVAAAIGVDWKTYEQAVIAL